MDRDTRDTHYMTSVSHAQSSPSSEIPSSAVPRARAVFTDWYTWTLGDLAGHYLPLANWPLGLRRPPSFKNR